MIFKDAAATIRRTGQDFQYQLVVQRAYEEGEEELADDEADENGAAGSLSGDKDEKIFLLDQALHFRSEIRKGGEKVLAWRDLSGDAGDLYEFVCDPSISAGEVGTFELVAIKCQYERKTRKPNETATEKDLQQFNFTEQPIPSASPIASPSPEPALQQHVPSPLSNSSSPTVKTRSKVREIMAPKPSKTTRTLAEAKLVTKAPLAAPKPTELELIASGRAELHMFDFHSGAFLLQDPSVSATVSEVGKWSYWLQISHDEKDWLGQPVVADINPVFNFEYLSFIFNHYTEEGAAFSWLLRFRNQDILEKFQEGLMRALWEHLNEVKWEKRDDDERQYVLDAFQDLQMKDTPEQEADEDEQEDGEDDGQRSEHYDTDESEDDVVVREDDGHVNSQLAVGYKHDRSFVVRGSKIGVFKHTPHNNLEFSTNISKVETPGGKLFSPKKVMLHAEDTNMILQKADDPHSLYRMDLEYGRVVDEWKIHDDIAVKNFAPDKVGQLVLEIAEERLTRSLEICPNDGRADLPGNLGQCTVPNRSSSLRKQDS